MTKDNHTPLRKSRCKIVSDVLEFRLERKSIYAL